ncbi:4078_t:CDS:1 [Dentiscutata erythropus]|uniref:4078_t:CDS:1 n=1 Tax=Dentiscutata erythropus TaxID=1348616 RepID=A0A9N8ZTB6_9GLOM|nr:4078_t:CDS:1 [Dentiscutata erythropus]
MNFKQIIEYFTEFYPNFPNNPVLNDIEEISRLMSSSSRTTNDRAMIALTVEYVARNGVQTNDRQSIRRATAYFLSLLQHRHRNQRIIYKDIAHRVNRYRATRNRFQHQDYLGRRSRARPI